MLKTATADDKEAEAQEPGRPAAGGLRARLRPVSLLLFLALGSGCGGGGGGLPPEAPIPLDGLSGSVMLPDLDLGRVIEQEPNDSSAQAFDLAPFWPRSTLEVTGTLGMTAGLFGEADESDHLRIRSCVDQRVHLALTFEEVDAIGFGPNDVSAAVFDPASGVELAATNTGVQPLELFFEATAYEAYEVVVQIHAGHGWYVVRIAAGDLPAAPPALRAAPDRDPAPTSPFQPVLAKPVLAKPQAACAGTHVLVRFDEDCDPATFCREEGLRLGRKMATGSYLVHLDCEAAPASASRALALGTQLRTRPGVRWAEPDWIVSPLSVPGDPLLNRQWNLPMVGAPSAWDITIGDPSVVVGVLDSGVIDHPDLEGQMVDGYDFVSEPDRAGDGDGRDPDPTDMGNQADGSGLSIWHGTHVASIVAARQGNGEGGSGVAPGVRLMMLRALGIGGGLVSDAVDAILFAAGRYQTADGRQLETRLPILNLSVGLSQNAPDLEAACRLAALSGVLLIGAAGNDGGGVLYPAAYPSVMAVAAVDGSMATTAYSNFGPEVDIAAPGGGVARDEWNDGWRDGILSALRDETLAPARPAYGYVIGTSQATPHVAGAAALLLSVDPGLNALELRALLKETALDRGPAGDDAAYGAGLLQVHEAMKVALERLETPRSDEPYLLLPTRSCQFDDFGIVTIRRVIPLYNGGAGRLEIDAALVRTDDGLPWLEASLTAPDGPGTPVNKKDVVITVDRNVVGAQTAARYSGTVQLLNAAGVQGAIRVVLYVDEQTRAGQDLQIIALESATGIARRKAAATADRGYRYWFRGLPEGEYRLQGGEDLDGNGFFCESFEACGWFGGPTEEDALPVAFVANEPALRGLGIDLVPQPPP